MSLNLCSTEVRRRVHFCYDKQSNKTFNQSKMGTKMEEWLVLIQKISSFILKTRQYIAQYNYNLKLRNLLVTKT